MVFSSRMPTTTSSFRIDPELKTRLDLVAKKIHKKKNWIVNQALNEYLSKHGQDALREEAIRQSKAAAILDRRPRARKEAELWERAAAEVWNAG